MCEWDVKPYTLTHWPGRALHSTEAAADFGQHIYSDSSILVYTDSVPVGRRAGWSVKTVIVKGDTLQQQEAHKPAN